MLYKLHNSYFIYFVIVFFCNLVAFCFFLYLGHFIVFYLYDILQVYAKNILWVFAKSIFRVLGTAASQATGRCSLRTPDNVSCEHPKKLAVVNGPARISRCLRTPSRFIFHLLIGILENIVDSH